ncbi:MAG: RIO1 family regulatory kinase/ATPase [Chloroflexota bacterium]
MSKYEWHERFEVYEYADLSRQAHRRQSELNNPQKKRKPNGRVTAALSDFDDRASEWVPTYCAPLDPRHYERQWVIDALSGFYRDELITDVTHLVKGGKEANVYCCEAHPHTGAALLAAKIYRPKMLRHLKNDAIYKEGRLLRDAAGKPLFGPARREKLAMVQKTRFGQELDTLLWIGNEFAVQRELFEAGADVPRPVAHSGHTILMAYLGEQGMAAPVLSDVSLTREEAQPLCERILHNVELMLAHNYVHGDLSAYNILYWEGEVTIIDFPQLVDARSNPHAAALLERDVQRVCDYFGRLGIKTEPAQVATNLWGRYLRGEL